jgi:hypothetical protein
VQTDPQTALLRHRSLTRPLAAQPARRPA